MEPDVGERRDPQQARASARRRCFLEVASRLIADRGYNAVSMTLIADEAKTSIGTLYDYFPDKESLIYAVFLEYTLELDAHWELLLRGEGVRSPDELARILVNGLLNFVKERPDYLAIFGTSLSIARDRSGRGPLRKTICNALKQLTPKRTVAQLAVRADVIVEILKGLLSTYRVTPPKQRRLVVAEYLRAIHNYLVE